MASLQARHARSCPLTITTADADALVGCTCKPSYQLSAWVYGEQVRTPLGRNRQDAQRALARVVTQQDDGSFRAPRKIRFDTWAAEWQAGLEVKPATIESYSATVRMASRAFGGKEVRRVTVSDVRGLLDQMRRAKLSPATRAKHCRALAACFQAAIESDYAARNPVRQLTRSERPRPVKRESAYFTEDELQRLFSALQPGLWRVLFATMLRTGLRLGEVSALVWGDIDLAEQVIHVRRTIRHGETGSPKSGERRSVHVGPGLVAVLGSWWGELDRPGDDTLVFPAPTADGYLSQRMVAGALRRAMTAASVSVVGPTGEKRTPHAFRHTFAKIALEQGRPITWVQRQLGHSTIVVTVDRYGHFEAAAQRREAEALDAAFGGVG